MVSLSQAQAILQAQCLSLASEEVSLFQAHGRILAQDLCVRRDLPAFSNSAMDGYAISEIGESYRLGGSVFAGERGGERILEGECIKLMTGAPTPPNALAILPFEQTRREGERIFPTHPIQAHQHIKLRGEDYALGESLLERGAVLDFSRLALLASQGIASIPVYRKLRIAIFASGDELKEPWEEAKPYQTYNTNAIAYHSLLKGAGIEAEYKGILPDCKTSLMEALVSFGDYDLVLTSGGASVGEADFFQEVLQEGGAEILFAGINLKPGRPMLAAKLNHTLILSLPGNPLSGALNLLSLVLPMLSKLSGAKSEQIQISAKLKGSLKLQAQRSHIFLGLFDGEYFVPFQGGKYGSGSLVPLVSSNAFVVLEEGLSGVEEGTEVVISPFRL